MNASEIERSLRADPPPQARAWVERVLGSGARVQAFARLGGGTACASHRVVLEGSAAELVLKRFVRRDWLEREPDVVTREARALELVVDLSVPTPELVALDASGEELDCPGLLMTRLPGRAALPSAPDDGWLEHILAPLLELEAHHRGGAARLLPAYRPFYELAALEPPVWTTRPDLFRRAIDLLRAGPPEFEPVFLHRDYHPANLLFADGRLSGVVDWTEACAGPAEIDFGHCRVNLAALYGPAVAQRFRELWTRAFGREPHAYWDLASLLSAADLGARVYSGWGELGFQGLTPTVLREHLEAHLAVLLEV